MIAHDAGGLVARSYIQSAAYGQGVLPSIDDLVMVGVPNAGVTDIWNLALNDWNADSSTRLTGQIVERAYDLMRSGTAINLVGVPSAVINNPNISLTDFVQQYVGSLTQLLPTYKAIDTDDDGQFEPLSATTVPGNTLINRLLVDLNGTANDPNAWLTRVGETHVIYSTEVETRDQIIKRTGPSQNGFLATRYYRFVT